MGEESKRKENPQQQYTRTRELEVFAVTREKRMEWKEIQVCQEGQARRGESRQKTGGEGG